LRQNVQVQERRRKGMQMPASAWAKMCHSSIYVKGTGESGTAIAWKKSRACCNEVVCKMLVLEESLVASATAMMNAR